MVQLAAEPLMNPRKQTDQEEKQIKLNEPPALCMDPGLPLAKVRIIHSWLLG